jgi:hypothetical protein
VSRLTLASFLVTNTGGERGPGGVVPLEGRPGSPAHAPAWDPACGPAARRPLPPRSAAPHATRASNPPPHSPGDVSRRYIKDPELLRFIDAECFIWSTVSADLTPMINAGMVFCDRWGGGAWGVAAVAGREQVLPRGPGALVGPGGRKQQPCLPAFHPALAR